MTTASMQSTQSRRRLYLRRSRTSIRFRNPLKERKGSQSFARTVEADELIRSCDIGFGSMLSKKDFAGVSRAPLIQDQASMRDSKIRSSGFVCFIFLIPQLLCGDFFDSIDPLHRPAHS
jgi:hypothetical protein